MPTPLPIGIWYEKARNRYRVKLYKNTIPYLAGYFRSLDKAMEAYLNLKKDLDKLPKNRKPKYQRKIGAGIKNLILAVKPEDN